ncbi:MAG: RdgB/HAM1 family non-canonical purine NTP pyrophosphatase [Clostridiales Family XIII bacterium]|jgi:XTP/dITP diphosphohydrolase|nr:RdgB/HAM1 family non-canonical purine NTP pyrophosphatase [Clostridiales Family XIII bacterium]
MIVVAATQNRHKILEISEITGKLGLEVIPRAAAGIPDFEIEEDGETFEENSLKKAMSIMHACGRAAVADDSGLEADALSGAPGVYSARFAGVSGDGADAENNKKLLRLLAEIPDEARTGRFVSVVTLAFPDGRTLVARGTCEGRIGRRPAGNGGFGYDPLFTPLGYEKTFAQLPAEVKNRISHRAKALAALAEMLAAQPFTAGG